MIARIGTTAAIIIIVTIIFNLYFVFCMSSTLQGELLAGLFLKVLNTTLDLLFTPNCIAIKSTISFQISQFDLLYISSPVSFVANSSFPNSTKKQQSKGVQSDINKKQAM
jgi:hypothetical protein